MESVSIATESFPVAKLWAKIQRESAGCWIWTGGRAGHRVGLFTFNKRRHNVRRLVYLLERGGQPAGTIIKSLCTSDLCVNPDHMVAIPPGGMLPDGRKLCSECYEALPPSAFARRSAAKSGLADYCRLCTRERSRARHYSLSRTGYRALLAAQGGVCAICGASDGRRRLFVDHDHESGVVRGLLCTQCNVGIGMFRDDPRLLLNANEYLVGDRSPLPQPSPSN